LAAGKGTTQKASIRVTISRLSRQKKSLQKANITEFKQHYAISIVSLGTPQTEIRWIDEKRSLSFQ